MVEGERGRPAVVAKGRRRRMNDFLLRQMLRAGVTRERQALLGGGLGVAAVSLRLLLYPLLGLGVPYISFFPVLLIASLLFDLAGGLACLAATTVGGVLILTRQPIVRPSLVGPLVSLPVYVASAATIIWFAMALRRSVTGLHAREQRERLLVGELQHRVKNTLSIVQAIAAQTQRASRDMDSFRAAFDDRLVALGQAHNILSRSAWTPITVRELAGQTLNPFVPREQRRLKLEGGEMMLSPDHVVTLALCFHELATNATKYGALSTPSGWIEVGWSAGGPGDRRVTVTWREHGGPPVEPPAREGFGSRILKAGFGDRSRTEAVLDFRREGLCWSASFDQAPQTAPSF